MFFCQAAKKPVTVKSLREEDQWIWGSDLQSRTIAIPCRCRVLVHVLPRGEVMIIKDEKRYIVSYTTISSSKWPTLRYPWHYVFSSFLIILFLFLPCLFIYFFIHSSIYLCIYLFVFSFIVIHLLPTLETVSRRCTWSIKIKIQRTLTYLSTCISIYLSTYLSSYLLIYS